jgi:hypothetical protein
MDVREWLPTAHGRVRLGGGERRAMSNAMTPINQALDGDLYDLMPLNRFLEDCWSRELIDYDGNGYYATATEVSKIKVVPSDITKAGKTPPEWATHVVWYNR